MKLPEEYKYIAIEGNIGSGKTTLSNMLSRDFKTRLLLEQFAENPFLADFYKDRERYAFPVEVFFLSERHKQMVSELSNRDLFNDVVVSDYIFDKTVLFARQNLNDSEFSVFHKLYNQLNHNLVPPDILIYLHRPVDALMRNIKLRNRSYETLITDEYLAMISETYLAYFKKLSDIPIAILNMGDLDFENNYNIYHQIIDIIKISDRPQGITYYDLK